MRTDLALGKLLDTVGGRTNLARALSVSYQAVSQWKRVPAEQVIKVEWATGVPREELRPDLYLAPRRPVKRQPARSL